MVNLWPFGKSDDASISAFEKTISALQTKIAKATTQRDFLRKASRRLQALWLLYTSFAYILFVLITFLVTGKDNLRSFEYTCLAGGPVLIYAVRTLLLTFYNYRISSANSYLSSLESQRESTIEKFKTATKYNTTQAVLERYGAAPPAARDAQKTAGTKGTKTSQPGQNQASQKQSAQPQRTGFAPPATANIQKSPTNGQLSPQAADSNNPTNGQLSMSLSPSESFAPNAFDVPPRSPQYATATASSGAPVVGHAWYDRLMDALLGEDESKPSNRIALICGKCKLVNGVAPPGVKTMEEIGQWRCAECREWNGSRDQILKILEDVRSREPGEPDGAGSAADTTKDEGEVAKSDAKTTKSDSAG